ncbi:hypothetical protein AB0A05_27510 [Streptomyces sp. NPDC046374]|uniref:hypothetical protein n=1 Tax=Streptomyces sp. NPDC046374 TaxID=3154917 RepID=UPI0033D72302
MRSPPSRHSAIDELYRGLETDDGEAADDVPVQADADQLLQDAAVRRARLQVGRRLHHVVTGREPLQATPRQKTSCLLLVVAHALAGRHDPQVRVRLSHLGVVVPMLRRLPADRTPEGIQPATDSERPQDLSLDVPQPWLLPELAALARLVSSHARKPIDCGMQSGPVSRIHRRLSGGSTRDGARYGSAGVGGGLPTMDRPRLSPLTVDRGIDRS